MPDESEDALLVEALGTLAGSGRSGAAFTAKRLKKNVGEATLLLPLGLDDALERVRGAMAEVSTGAEPWRVETGTDGTGGTALRVMAGGGFGGLNPVVVTVVVNSDGEQGTSVRLRAAAKEGLIKQRAGEKTVDRLAGLLER
ncbi:hypothetical protein ACWERY_19140 [Streptomyces sp. NPDC004082]|uniref:hypothetical protein n=1 Tax=Streptomyces sp. NPDC005481 TaxID=3154881 RepID=UPI0033B6A663